MNIENIMLNEISQSEKEYRIPFIQGPQSSQIHKDGKYNGGYKGPGKEMNGGVIV